MKTLVVMALVLPWLLVTCTSNVVVVPNGTIVDSNPDSVVIYDEGWALIQQNLAWGTLDGAFFRLPGKSVTNTVVANVDGAPLSFAVETVGGRDYLHFARNPNLDKKKTVQVRLKLLDVNYETFLDADVTSDQELTLSLRALVVSAGLSVSDCPITLFSKASGKKPSVSYDLGKQTLTPFTRKSFTIKSAVGRYQTNYSWSTADTDWVAKDIELLNPLNLTIHASAITVFAKNLIVGTATIDQTQVGESLSFSSGSEPGIELFRSVVTKEIAGRKINPFTHNLEYRLKSSLPYDVTVSVITTTKHGNEHRSEYHYTTPPSSEPGELKIWDLKLIKNSVQSVAFSIDSDQPRFDEYNEYEHAAAQ